MNLRICCRFSQRSLVVVILVLVAHVSKSVSQVVDYYDLLHYYDYYYYDCYC
uniref:Uncharacterized protein n=1 Tax=Anguilla anguilla TaxID=7936 RepID=A0A0E9XWI7_ANGAN